MIGATYLVKGYVNARRWNMKLKSITLQNFRGIEKLTIVLDEKTTVFFGINGVGKSTILRAVDLIYANIIAKLIGTGKKDLQNWIMTILVMENQRQILRQYFLLKMEQK